MYFWWNPLCDWRELPSHHHIKEGSDLEKQLGPILKDKANGFKINVSKTGIDGLQSEIAYYRKQMIDQIALGYHKNSPDAHGKTKH